ncbi:MAG: hypothetical protein HWE20_06545 [Gammaproteobacteria bacterium]|nr:hypothetical protein [Gammaproteobacteria bacterium]
MYRHLHQFSLIIVAASLPELMVGLQGSVISGSIADFAFATSAAAAMLGLVFKCKNVKIVLPALVVGLLHVVQPLLEVLMIAAMLQVLAIAMRIAKPQSTFGLVHNSVATLVTYFIFKQILTIGFGYLHLSVWAFTALYLFTILGAIALVLNVSHTTPPTAVWRPARSF